ncbi:MAG: energy-coupling factor ABC transporter substrate-binding protein [Candidatus Methanomethylophilaceae archaeon]|jgi:cobalt/nickel transport protein|nr:energy-coupling factor ABC transporter substrate-binding protein [Candidatus Methanomethylophilaceae archaeon]MDD2936458.1 energy-coupling factor ABC transporter substrate-binding protein [Candidatus Methanomethylophilaceae archaeon]MDD3351690.1 energy-coupling factor ABC transporter substrate-binding protein [Candidatus Methanomethylophilaceae archaeon]MDD3986155.1 energy-coupling factor ABC transporter substrate-binding protein [Candidatus Methanomethylophilaceae archaeon]MDY0251829.1 ener
MNISNRTYYMVGFTAIAAMVVVILAYGAYNGFEFAGADDQGGDAISEIDPSYEPWWDGIWGSYELPGETESMLFALQAAIGAIIIGYAIGYFHAVDKARKGKLPNRQ